MSSNCGLINTKISVSASVLSNGKGKTSVSAQKSLVGQALDLTTNHLADDLHQQRLCYRTTKTGWQLLSVMSVQCKN